MTDLISREDALAEVELYRRDWADARDAIAILPAAQVKVKPLVWRESVGPQGVEWNAFCALLDKGWTAYSVGAMREIDAVRAARVLATLDLSPTPVDASQTPDFVPSDPRVKVLVEAAKERLHFFDDTTGNIALAVPVSRCMPPCASCRATEILLKTK